MIKPDNKGNDAWAVNINDPNTKALLPHLSVVFLHRWLIIDGKGNITNRPTKEEILRV